MRKDRSWWWHAVGAGVALLIGLSGSALAQPDASRDTKAPTLVSSNSSLALAVLPSPSATASPSASAGLICGPETSLIVPERVIRGGRVTGWFTGFQPNATVTITFRPDNSDFPERAIGATTTDEHGYGEVDVVIPVDAPIGWASVILVLGECATTEFPAITLASIVVVPVLPEISIDDDTVVPGQRVTIRGSGFAQDDIVYLSLDDPEQLGECASCLVATAPTTSVGSVVITVRLPHDLSPGTHTLSLSGWGPELLFPEVLSVDIAVGAGATIPPTDTN